MVHVTKNRRLLERLFAALDWPHAVREHDEFPVRDLGVSISADFRTMIVRYKLRGAESYLEDPASEFPSTTLVASLKLLAGPVEDIRHEHLDSVRRKEEWLERKYQRELRMRQTRDRLRKY